MFNNGTYFHIKILGILVLISNFIFISENVEAQNYNYIPTKFDSIGYKLESNPPGYSVFAYPLYSVSDFIYAEVGTLNSTKAKYRIYDMKGKLLKEMEYEIPEGSVKTKFCVTELPPGRYMFKITDGKYFDFSVTFSKC